MVEDGKPRGEQQVMQISNRSKRECGEAETKLETCPHFGPDPVPDLGLRCKHQPPKTLAADGHDAMAEFRVGYVRASIKIRRETFLTCTASGVGMLAGTMKQISMPRESSPSG